VLVGLQDIIEHKFEFPLGWKEKAEEILEERKRKAIKEWEDCLCGDCVHLEKSSKVESAYRKCVVGCGHVVTECDRYERKDK